MGRKMARAVVLLITALYTLDIVHSADWDYSTGANGPAHWVNHYSKCGGSSQSPINIDSTAVTSDPDMGVITFSGYDTTPSAMTIKNNGHTVQVDVEGAMQISGGKLPATYKLAQFHVHWGDANSKGSEHTVDNMAYPMEIHFVHYNTMYSGLGQAVDKPNGLAVIGVFFEIGEKEPGQSLQILENALSTVQFKDSNSDLTPFALRGLLPADTNKFYRYSGSLTTPTCDESVVWTILESKIVITQAHMDLFRTRLYEGNDASSPQMVNNFRPVQSLNGREVFSNQANAAGDVTSHVTSVVVMITASVIINIF